MATTDEAETDAADSYYRDVAKQKESLDKDLADQIAEQREFNKRYRDAAERARQEQKPYVEDVRRAEEDYARTAARLPRQITPPRPPSTEEMIRPTNLQRTFGMAAIFSLLAAGITKDRSMLGITALGGFMKGAREGNAELARASLEDFHSNMEYVRQVNEQSLKEYNLILGSKKLTLEQKDRMLKLKMQEFGDQQFALELEQKGMNSVNNLFKERATMNHQMASELHQIEVLKNTMRHQKAMEAKGGVGSAGGVMQVFGIPYDQIPQAAPGQKNEAFLSMLPDPVQQLVKQMDAGSLPVSGFGGFAVKDRNELLKAAAIYNPNFDARKYGIQTKVAGEFTPGGPVGSNVLAINTMVQHIKNFAEAFDKLDNTQVERWNAAKNKLASEFGDPALRVVQQAALRVAGEYARVIKGGRAAPTDQEMQHWEAVFSSNMSKPSMRAVVWDALEGAGGRLTAIEDMYQKEMGKPYGALSPQSRTIIAQFKPKSVSMPSWMIREARGGAGPTRGQDLETKADAESERQIKRFRELGYEVGRSPSTGKLFYRKPGEKWQPVE